jgi:hypothetical protein
VHLLWKILERLSAERLLRRLVVQRDDATVPSAAEDVRVNAACHPNS